MRSPEPAEKASQDRRDDNQEAGKDIRRRKLVLNCKLFFYFFKYFLYSFAKTATVDYHIDSFLEDIDKLP